MPIPGGEITTSEIWVNNANDNQAVEATEAEQVQEETDATEQAVESDNNNEGE